jgi:gliding motility-associated-like protein
LYTFNLVLVYHFLSYLYIFLMKKTVLFFSLFLLSHFAFSQVFWTETFGTGCNQLQLANGFNSGNGVWTIASTGLNQTFSNFWYVSATESGMGVGNCGAGCLGTGTTNRTLHIGNVTGSPLAAIFCPTGDCGAAYDAGVGTNSVTTNKRAQSPTINCSGKYNIILNFNYIMGANPPTDAATVMYFDGATWTQISAPPSTNNASCGGQGLWTAYSVALPASANNNPSVKVGFNWVNIDGNLAATDPSFAVDDIKLSITPLSPTLTLPSPVCEANVINASYSSTLALTYSWTATSANVVFSPSNSGTTAISFTAPGTYTVSLTVCSGTTCSTATSSVQVIATPTINVTASPTVICSPGSSTLTASGGPSATSYSWTVSSGPAITNTNIAVVSPTATTNYTVLTSVPGCTTGVAFNIPVSPKPTLTVTPNSGICNGQTINLTSNGGATYTWSPASSLNTPNGSVVTASPTVTTTYTVTGYDGVCTNTAVVTVTVNASASVTVTPTNTTICSGQSANLVASGGSSYTWTASSGANPANLASVSVSPTTTTTYTVLTGIGTCTAAAIVSVSVAPIFTLSVTPSNTTICGGGSGTSLTGAGGVSYTWTPATGLSSTTGANVTANPTVSTSYTLLGSNGVCTNSATATVSVIIVNATITASSINYCTGVSPVSLTGSGGTTYSWSPATGLSSTTGSVVSATPSVTTIYSLTASTGACSSVKTITITVPATSSISVISSGTIICTGSAGSTLTASGASTYTWMPGSVMTASNVVNPSVTTTYTVNGQTAAGCIAFPATITVSVAPSITPTLTASSATVCLTKTISINATPTGAGITYTWSPSSAIQGSINTSSIIAKPTTSATVIYTLTLSNGSCVSTKTISIQVFNCDPPIVSFTTLTNNSICTGGCVTFTSTTSGSTPIAYQWVVPGGTPSTSTLVNPQICFNTAGNYTVGLIATNAYGVDTLIISNFINVADTPSVVKAFGDTLIKIGHTTPISATGATTYYWTPDNGSVACSTCSNTIAQPTVTTQYIVIGYNSQYCYRQDTITVSVDDVCDDFFVPNVFSPNGDGLNESVNVHGLCISTFNLQMYNRWGEKVFETSDKTVGWDGTFKGKPMDTGVFMYKVNGVTLDGKLFLIKGNVTLLR